VGSRNGISTETLEALLGDYAKSPLFTDAEKVALEYADAITDTRATWTTSCSRACKGTTTTTPSRS
jgi:hypothetical protein